MVVREHGSYLSMGRALWRCLDWGKRPAKVARGYHPLEFVETTSGVAGPFNCDSRDGCDASLPRQDDNFFLTAGVI